MNAFTIKDLENLSGIKAHTIRIWEQRYHFLKPNRTDTNIRYYSNDDLKKVLNIALLNKYGFKISHIDKMNESDMKDKVMLLSSAEAQQERIVNELIEGMIELDIDRFESLLNKHIKARGIERTISQIIFPFLERTGILWLTNHINPAQEHLVTNIIRQKLMVGIESCNPSFRVNKKILMFLPEGEYHELGLLFMYFVFRSRGMQVFYLGANIPIRDVAFVAKIKSPDYLYTHLTAMGAHFNFDKFIHQVSHTFPQSSIIISGNLTRPYEKKVPQGISLKKSLSEMMEFVAGLHSQA
jgi:DNA-binding transcriptional MerR regulator